MPERSVLLYKLRRLILMAVFSSGGRFSRHPCLKDDEDPLGAPVPPSPATCFQKVFVCPDLGSNETTGRQQSAAMSWWARGELGLPGTTTYHIVPNPEGTLLAVCLGSPCHQGWLVRSPGWMDESAIHQLGYGGGAARRTAPCTAGGDWGDEVRHARRPDEGSHACVSSAGFHWRVGVG